MSGVFNPNPKSQFGHGDNKNTNDAILIILGKGENGGVNQTEIFVCRGQKYHQVNLYRLLCDGDLYLTHRGLQITGLRFEFLKVCIYQRV